MFSILESAPTPEVLLQFTPPTLFQRSLAAIRGNANDTHVAELLWLCQVCGLEPWHPLLCAEVNYFGGLDVSTTVRGYQAIAEASGRLLGISPTTYEGKGDDLAATVMVRTKTPAGADREDAVTLFLREWVTDSEAWRDRPRYMLSLRAQGYALRQAFPILLGAVQLRTDGLSEKPREWKASEARARAPETRRRVEREAARPEPEPAPTPPPPEPPPKEAEPKAAAKPFEGGKPVPQPTPRGAR